VKGCVKLVIPHLLASAICLVIFTAAPIILYGILVVIGLALYGDPGGPLNFIIVPLFSVILALVATFVLLLPITAILQWLSNRLKFSKWIPLLGILPASLVVFITVAFTFFKPKDVGETLIFLVVWCLIGSICFAFYWIPLNFADAILKRIRA
jgi:hypothetical protein